MPAIITVASLRTVLGVSVALYSDAYLEGIIDSAEQVILPLLTANQNAVAAVYLQNNVAYYVTQKPNTFPRILVGIADPALFIGLPAL